MVASASAMVTNRRFGRLVTLLRILVASDVSGRESGSGAATGRDCTETGVLVRAGNGGHPRGAVSACHTAMMKRFSLFVCTFTTLAALPVFARGVSPYLPLNLEPEIEQQ